MGFTLVELGTGRYPYPPGTDEDTLKLRKMVRLLQGNNYEELRELASESRCSGCEGLTTAALHDYVVKGVSLLSRERN